MDHYKEKDQRDQLLSPKTKVKNWLVTTSQPTSPSQESFNNANAAKTNAKHAARNAKNQNKSDKLLPNITHKSNPNPSNNKDLVHFEDKDSVRFLFHFVAIYVNFSK
jgi:hypothetical protein